MMIPVHQEDELLKAVSEKMEARLEAAKLRKLMRHLHDEVQALRQDNSDLRREVANWRGA